LLFVPIALGLLAAAFFVGRNSVDRSSPAPAPGSYRAGYLAGREDAFAGFDGGWALGVPYAVTLERAGGGITYKFARRWAMQPGVTYSVCGHEVCARP
jgi:hypothetical protein